MNPCDNCALRLFNSKCYNLQGIGDKWSGNVIVLPNVDYDAYKGKDMSFSSQKEILTQSYPTGELIDKIFIVPLIRCNEQQGCEVNTQIINNCLIYFERDAEKFQFKNIMLCGSAANRFLNIDNITPYLNNIIIDSKTRRRYFINYSPLVKYIDADKFEVFKECLKKYVWSVSTGLYDYDTIVI